MKEGGRNSGVRDDLDLGRMGLKNAGTDHKLPSHSPLPSPSERGGSCSSVGLIPERLGSRGRALKSQPMESYEIQKN